MIVDYPSSVASRSFLLPMLILFVLLYMVLLAGGEVQAEIRYVKPSDEAVVRTGQGTQYKIVSVVKEGDKVELLEEDDGYALVKLENGAQGWIVRRYLHRDPPLDMVVAQLREEKDELLKKDQESSRTIEEISTLLSTTRTDLDMLVAERDKIAADYQKLQRDTADVIKIKNDMQKTAEENRKLAEKITVLETENTSMKKDRTINWFLAGGGVLFFGILLGKMPGPSRRRKPSLLS